MAGGHGGPRTPAKPASVSGPGKYSKRTDGGPAQVLSAAPGQDYGDKKAQLDAQRVAPMGAAAPMPKAAQAAQAQGASLPQFAGPGLTDPTQRPGQPITAGTDIGPGPDSSILGLNSPAAGTGQMTALLQRLSATDTTGILGKLMQAAQARNA